MNIHCLVIPNEEIKQRAGFTGADWWFDEKGDLQIRIAQMSSREREMSLAVHEIVECILAKFHGVKAEDVDAFDEAVEKTPEGAANHGIDAGDLPGCPYSREHMAATACERVVAMELGIGSWREYDDELGSL